MGTSRGLFYDPVLGDFWRHVGGETRHVVRVRWTYNSASTSEEPVHYTVEWVDDHGDRRQANETGWREWVFPRGISSGPRLAQREGFVSPMKAETR